MENIENNDVNWIEDAGLDAIEWAYNFACEDYQPHDYEDDEDNIPYDLPEDPDWYFNEIEQFITFDSWYMRNILGCMGLLGYNNSEEELDQINDFFNQVEEYAEDLEYFASHCLQDDDFNYKEWADKYEKQMYQMIDNSCATLN